MSRSSIQLRRVPRQARSRETFERILRAAVEVLEEEGWDGFTTNLLAERADIAIQALYRYFPNKLVVVATLAERMTIEWDGWFEDFADAIDAGGIWSEVWADYIDVFLEGVRDMPGALAVRRAMAANPELREIDQKDNERLARGLGGSLRRCDPSLSAQESYATARMLIETATATIDSALVSPPATARRMITELKSMHIAYLRERVKFGGPTRTRQRR